MSIDGPPTAIRRPALARPTLIPGLRLLWRSRRRLQLGVDPARAVVLELPEPGTARLLDLLDGTRSERTVLAHARRYGIAEPDARAMIDSLHAAGLVVSAQSLLPHQFPDPVRRRLASEAAALSLRRTRGTATAAQILRQRAAARVAVTGGGPLAGPVAAGLARAGVGHVAPMLDRTAEAEDAAATIARQAPGARTAALRRREVTFAVQVGDAGPAAVAAAGYAGRRLPHLVMTVRDAAVVVGPLVPPAGSPCLNCLDLHRQDRDPEWPTVAAQLAAPAPHPAPCAAATALIATGLAVSEVLSWIDGTRPATLGASVEITASGRMRQRSWPPHPGCHCLRRSRRGTMAR
jgi:bacteriocin biosynthesis cyclodehydratase domain-containing protein